MDTKEISKSSNTTKKSKKLQNVIIPIAVVLVVVVLVFIALFTKNKIKDNRYKSEYVTAESNITMQTAAEGETEIITDQF